MHWQSSGQGSGLRLERPSSLFKHEAHCMTCTSLSQPNLRVHALLLLVNAAFWAINHNSNKSVTLICDDLTWWSPQQGQSNSGCESVIWLKGLARKVVLFHLTHYCEVSHPCAHHFHIQFTKKLLSEPKSAKTERLLFQVKQSHL